MAGSLAHILKDDGSFTADLVETEGDKIEALQECHQIIAELLETIIKGTECLNLGQYGPDTRAKKQAALKLVCERLGFPIPAGPRVDAFRALDEVVVPIIQHELHGGQSAYRPDGPREWFIWSEEHNAWWRPASRGYTDRMSEAGRYDFHEACKIVGNANASSPPPGKKFNEQMVRIPMELL